MNKIDFAAAIHFHQPTGNFDHIMERAHRLCYKPFLQLLSDYPDIKMTFHISGCLLDYLERHHKGTLELIERMVSAGQVEMMGGGYYEPILTALTEKDIKGQIAMMSEYIKKRFNHTPRGMWVPERVWAPYLTEIIYRCGIRYIILDDTHFLKSGVARDAIHGYYTTGKGSEKIAAFPSDKMLRYTIPFKLPHETIDYFRNEAKKREGLLFTYGDDGEKFGEWPGTHKWVFEEKWLKKFFDALQQNREWIRPVHFSDYLKRNKPSGHINIKEASYEEMMEWSGGRWLNYLSKYPESNQMHKKMLYVSKKIETLQARPGKQDAGRIQHAQKQLYEGECNCAYWHGVFGGLYLYHLRSAIYKHLIEADKLADAILHKADNDWINIKKEDFYQDKKNEVIIENNTLSALVDPNEGAVIKEIDYRPFSFNLVNGLSRKEEAYHQKIIDSLNKAAQGKVYTIHDDFRTATPEIASSLIYDQFTRYFLRDHFIKGEPSVEDFLNSSYSSLGGFADGKYSFKIIKDGALFGREGELEDAKIAISKKISVSQKNTLEFDYAIAGKRAQVLNGINFAIEFNVTMPYLNSDRYKYFKNKKTLAGLNEEGSVADASSFGIADREASLGIEFKFSRKPKKIFYFPVKTVSQSERTYELNYQCSCIFCIWDFNLPSRNSLPVRVGMDSDRNSASAKFPLRRSEEKDSMGVSPWSFNLQQEDMFDFKIEFAFVA